MSLCFPPLPYDLLHPIVEQIWDSRTLLQLCLVCKAFHAEAQKALYREVHLNSKSIRMFHRTITHLVPKVQPCVRTLSVQLSNSFTEVHLLRSILHSLPHLYALEITPPQAKHWAHIPVYDRSSRMVPWAHRGAARMLHDCPFRLKVFRSAFRMTNPDFITFLGQQSEIEELWSSDMAGCVVTLPATFLPMLRSVKCAVAWIQFTASKGLASSGALSMISDSSKVRRDFSQERIDIQTRFDVLF